MQKKIIALAVAGLMSGAAFAQSNVTISGVLDAGLASVKSDVVTGGATENAAYNGSATSSVWVKAQEDLGNGMQAGMALETQPFATAAAGGTSLGQIQHYVWIGSKGFGTLSAGKKNTLTLKSLTTIQPFGTTVSGGYGNVLTADTRHEGVVAYDSPSFNGFTVGLMFKPKNDGHSAGSNSYGYLNLGANYNAGPLNVTFAHAKQETPNDAVNAANGTYAFNSAAGLLTTGSYATQALADAAAAAAIAGQTALQLVAPTAAAGATQDNVKNNVLGGNYAFGPVTAYLGWQSYKADRSGTTTADYRVWNIAAKFMATSNISIAANYARGNDKMPANADTKLFGLGADYMMSKRTAAYFRYENRDMNTNASNVGKVRTAVVGMRHAF